MHRNTFILFFLLLCSSAFGQNIECKYLSTAVISEEVKKMEDAALRNMVIQQLSANKRMFSLKFSGGKYLFEEIPDASQGNGNVMSLGSESSSVYMDVNNRISVSQENILDRTFLIKEKMKNYDWKITTESKDILNKKCTKAILRKDSDIVVAWFTPEIPISFGPLGYYGLPGLILQLETAKRNYLLQEISFPKGHVSMKVPGKGKKVSREEFEKLVKKKQASLGIGQEDGNKVKVIEM